MSFSAEQLMGLRERFLAKQLRLRADVQRRGISADRGTKTQSLIDALRFEAVASYVLDRNADGFRSTLAECVALKAMLFEAKRGGEDIVPHAVTFAEYGFVYYGFAAGRPEVARRVALALHGETPQAEINYVAMALCKLLTGEAPHARHYLAEAVAVCGDEIFAAYAQGIQSIADSNQGHFAASLRVIASAHERECKTPFSEVVDTEEELLSLWGVGIANLGTYFGLTIPSDFDSPVIPRDLLVTWESRWCASGKGAAIFSDD
jgi:hypothetical protein